MSTRISRHPRLRGGAVALVVALMAPMALAACQPGTSGSAPGEGAQDASQEGNPGTDGLPRSNADPGQGGAVASSDAPGSDEGEQTGFEGLWILDRVVNGEGTEDVLGVDDVTRYDTAYELVCAMQLYHDEEGGNEFACSLPGVDMVGAWSVDGETGATLVVPVSEDSSVIGKCELSDDGSKMAVMFPSGDDAADVIYMFSRDDGSTSLEETYVALSEQNDALYDGLSIDEPFDITFVDTGDLTMRLVGTTRNADGNLIGYVIEATNKTGTPLIINDFVDGHGGTPFSVNGLPGTALALTGRVLPPATRDGDGNALTTTMRCAILFDQDEVGDFLTGCSGELVVTDYHWNEVGRYPFAV